jgi:phenylpropionate dioxygenase-like ring-hydroxylating dioxygenase large terminal subunit
MERQERKTRVRIPADAIGGGAVRAIEIDGMEFVAWRGRDGRVRTAPRQCPHLDHDLTEGNVCGDELVCAGHGWGFDGDGRAFKRNEFGRVDPKGCVPTLGVRELDGIIEFTSPENAT